MGSSGREPWDEDGAVVSTSYSSGESSEVGIGDLRPYRVRLSLTYEYLVLAGTHADACSVDTAKDAVKYEMPDTEHEDTWRITADETDLSTLPAHWDDDSNLYGTGEDVSVREVREALAEREAMGLDIGTRVYDRRMDLFGEIEAIIAGPEIKDRKNRMARVKYEFPMDPSAEPREVRLGDLIAAHKAERIG